MCSLRRPQALVEGTELVEELRSYEHTMELGHLTPGASRGVAAASSSGSPPLKSRSICRRLLAVFRDMVLTAEHVHCLAVLPAPTLKPIKGPTIAAPVSSAQRTSASSHPGLVLERVVVEEGNVLGVDELGAPVFRALFGVKA